MSGLMGRRGFVLGAFASMAEQAMAQGSGHSLAVLDDVRTRQKFSPQCQSQLVLCMTAQKYYLACGEAFAGVAVAMQNLDRDQVEPILVVPHVEDQLDPSNTENLTLATKHFKDVGFRILTGRVAQMRDVHDDFGRVFEFLQGKISGHTLDGMLVSASGVVMDRRPAEDYIHSWEYLGDAMAGQHECAQRVAPSV